METENFIKQRTIIFEYQFLQNDKQWNCDTKQDSRRKSVKFNGCMHKTSKPRGFLWCRFASYNNKTKPVDPHLVSADS